MLEKGLTGEEVRILQEKYGKNEINVSRKESFWLKIVHVLCEPMFLLLIVTAMIYFILGSLRDGVIMLVFVIVVILIDLIQEWKTDKTLNALKNLSEPKIMVLRDGHKIEIASSELVPGDIMYIHEGVKIPADGYVVKCSGLCVDESNLTGESIGRFKTAKEYDGADYWRDDYCYQGTLVIQGTGIVKVDKTGSSTEYGKIGLSLGKIVDTKTPLLKQTDKLIKFCAIFAFGLFVLVGIFTFINLSDYSLKKRIVESILSGVTLAMAMIPEEFPVVLTVFLSMGAWRLAKKDSLVKKLPSVETLGAVSVLCVDKTGTITKNQMEIVEVVTEKEVSELARIMCLSCEEETYDPMEKAMFRYAKQWGIYKKDLFALKKLREYPFSNETKMMACAYEQAGKVILACKGSFESVVALCSLDRQTKKKINSRILKMQEAGLRVIAVASRESDDISFLKDNLGDMPLNLVGIVGLIDPPRDGIRDDISLCQKAGIRVVMITGDNGITAKAIARKVGISDNANIITGAMLNKMTDEELIKRVRDVSIFSRVVPEHKMRIVKALETNGEIVAMTGDGVNDAPALKQAEIGIAMGRGGEVSKEAADLILLDDNFSTIVDTIEDGRRIYDNIKKAIGYILVIHIPIALCSLLAPLLGIVPSNLMLLPLHVVLLELIIDPTCSVVLERQPAESNIMERSPRKINDNIVDRHLIIKSLLQGIMIFLVSFGTYYYLLDKNILLARTMALLIIMVANIFLVQVNASEYDYTLVSVKKMMHDKVMVVVNLIMLLGIIVIVYSPLHKFLKLCPLSFKELLVVLVLSFISVFWYEIVKVIKRQRNS